MKKRITPKKQHKNVLLQKATGLKNMEDVDEKFMHYAIELARKGLGNVAPNPMVGAVIVHNGKVIGEGFHRLYGEDHAEVNAIHSIKKENIPLLSVATIYVTLEPCAHFGKTPPCASLIAQKKIPRAVIGCLDPYPKVAGQGIKILEDAGIKVVTGVAKKACRHLIRRFLTFQEHQRPYIILKWAETADGYMAPKTPGQQWISNGFTKRLSHCWRTEEQAILVGRNTALIDNPQLTARLCKGKNPLRLVMDRKLQLPHDLHLFDQSTPTVVFTERDAENLPNLNFQKLDFSSNIIPQILTYLHSRQINSLIVEGGKQVLESFIGMDLWDEARVFVGDQFWGEGVNAPKLKPGKLMQKDQIDNNELRILFRRGIESPVEIEI